FLYTASSTGTYPVIVTVPLALRSSGSGGSAPATINLAWGIRATTPGQTRDKNHSTDSEFSGRNMAPIKTTSPPSFGPTGKAGTSTLGSKTLIGRNTPSRSNMTRSSVLNTNA